MLNKYFLLVAICFFFNKMIFNESGSPQGGFNANLALFLNAIFTIVISAYAAITQKRLFNIAGYTPFIMVYLYFILAAFSTLYSGIKLITLYNSALGVIFVLFSQAILKSIISSSNGSFDLAFKQFNRLVLTLAVCMMITAIFFELVYLNNYSFYKTGVGADFSAMLFVYYGLSNLLIKKNINSIVFFILLVLISVRLNSFSSYLSILLGGLAYLFIIGRVVTASVIVALSVSLVLAAVSFLSNNLDLVINNKPAAAYLSGSGRFAYYLEAFNVILNEFSLINLLIGKGYMAERVFMEGRGLYWVTDPHSSILLSVLGLGVMGLTLYILFLFYPYYFYFKNKKSLIFKADKIRVQHLLVFHSVASSYGVTSSYYLGRPSFLLILGLVALGLIISITKSCDKTYGK